MVGTPGSEATRVLVVTPMARSAPDLMCAAAGATATTVSCTWPPSTSFISGPMPL